MSSLVTGKGILEIVKFAVYVSVPIALTYVVATDSKAIHKLMGFRPYVVYPPQGPLPPTPEELWEMARELSRKNNAHKSAALCGISSSAPSSSNSRGTP